MTQKLSLAVLLCASVIAAIAQQPQVTNTRFASESVGKSLFAAVDRFQHSGESRWIGYELPALPQTHFTSCSNWSKSGDRCCGEYLLERDNNNISTSDRKSNSPSDLYILIRLDHGTITNLRSVMAGCHLNAGGVDFTWLTGVQSEESATFLGRLAANTTEDGTHRLVDEALAALSMHATSVATQVLGELTSSKHNLQLREKAAFWLGVERGHDGFVILQQLARTDSDSSLREKLTFDLSQNSDSGATDELIRMAKSDENTKVREQALFWLAQKAGKKAASTLSSAVESDSELSVKKKAVFALSQLPQGEGIPQLIHVAETNSNPSLKKEAIFWIGQSKDPRALQYLEEVLRR
jgi:HEAT repeat protein